MYRIILSYNTWSPQQPFIYDLMDEQVALQVFHALMQHSDFLLSREDCVGSLYKSKSQEELHLYASLNDWHYPDQDDGETYWDDWVSPDGLDVHDYLKAKTVRL